ncbi:MAG: Na/Pi cotransporter family protein [Burkholderiaceae bacterium]|nr:Na/Pi cotransporter family protein [Burkholderiaceae bacterium]
MNALSLWVFSVLSAIFLFLHGLEAFSEEVTRLGGERLRRGLARLTRSDWRAALVGGLATAVVQSSSAVTSMVTGLAHKRTLSPRAAVGLMIGANVGTTVTAWLVAFKIEALGPIFVTLGGLWSLLGPKPWRPYGKAIFYFGLIFLALDLVAQSLAPLAHSPQVAAWHPLLQSRVMALLFGTLLTAFVQSSSVVSGFAVVATSQGILAPDVAVWIVAGANLGTTSTALLASASLGPLARRLGLFNSAFNLLGVLLFATVLQPVIAQVMTLPVSPAWQVAMVHTLFNLTAAVVGLALLPRLWPRLETMLLRA